MGETISGTLKDTCRLWNNSVHHSCSNKM